MTVEPHVGQRVRSRWGLHGLDLVVIAVSGRGDRAFVTVEVPLEDPDGSVWDTMTMTYLAGDLDAA